MPSLLHCLTAEQARKKSIELTKSGVLSMQLVINPGEPSPELSGEEEFSQWCWDVLEKNGVQEKFKSILMIKGRHLNHFSNRADKISMMQEVCGTRLLPLAVPLNEMTDYTSVRVSFNAMLSAEGFKELWTVGQEPPASVVEWWGANDWDIFALLNGNEISANITKIIRSRYNDSSCIGFLKSKLRDCYEFRLGKTAIPLASYHMQISDQLVLEKKKAKKVETVKQANLEEAVQEEGAPVEGEAKGEEDGHLEDRQMITEEDREIAEREAEWEEAKKRRDERRKAERELRPQTERLELLHDPNSSALFDPAVATVVTTSSLLKEKSLVRSKCSSSGLGRPARTTRKCPHCIRTFSDDLRLQAHVENQH